MTMAAPERPKVEFKPKGGGLELWTAKDREILYEGPANTGKSRVDLERVHELCMLYPGIRVLLCRHKRISMSQSILVTWEEKVLEGGRRHPCVVGSARRENRTTYRYPDRSISYRMDMSVVRLEEVEGAQHLVFPWGGYVLIDGISVTFDGQYATWHGESEIALGGLDEHTATRTFSTEYDLIVVHEAIEVPFSAYQKLLRCLRNKRLPWQQIVAETNPGSEYHWLNQRADTPGEGGAPKMRRIYSRHTDNPTVTEEDLATLRSLEGADRARLYEGKWVSEEGQVWPHFDPATHCFNAEVYRHDDGFLWIHPDPGDPEEDRPGAWVGPTPIRLGWTFASVDWGERNPTTVQVWGVDKDLRMYLICEYYHTMYAPHGVVYDIDWWAARVEELDKEFGPLVAVVCDHDPGNIKKFNDVLGPLRGRSTAPIAIAAEKGPDSREVGRKMVSMGLQIDKDDRPGIFLLNNVLRCRDEQRASAGKPTCLKQEVPSFVWAKAEDGKPVKDEEDKTCEEHGCSALMYARVWFWNRDHTPLAPKPTYKPGTYGHLFHRKKRVA